ncbi:MAG: polysaccharide deacetylase family protein [Oscillospiraceae bacterium]|nr:polysaccharide deacetylase family protein [Oscillospiraceae bacterium]
MQKKILCAVLATVLTFTLGGCFRRNEDRDPSSENTRPSSSQPSSENRDENSRPGVGSDISDAVSDIGDGASDIVSDIEEGVDDMMPGDDGEHDGDGDVLDDGMLDKEDPTDGLDGGSPKGGTGTRTDGLGDGSGLTSHDGARISPDGTYTPGNDAGLTASLPDEAVETAASADLSALSNKKQGWGQGVQVNDKNQPLGSLSFQDRYGKYDAHFIGPDEHVLYLTFDCGYENGCTPMILDTLKQKDVKAVFFVTLDYIKSEPELIKRMIDEGHIIGNHSDKHPSFPDVDTARREQEIRNVDGYLAEHFGYTGMNLFRPPAGEFSEQVLAQMQAMGYKTVFWSYAYKDWDPNNQMGPEKAFEKVSGALHDGAIYLLHAVSSDNAAILGDFIDHAREQGYSFELFA